MAIFINGRDMSRTNSEYQGKQRLVILKYSYFLILVFWIIHKKEYFVRKEFPSTQNLYDENDLEQITKQQAYEYTNGETPRVKWYRTYLLVLIAAITLGTLFFANGFYNTIINSKPMSETGINDDNQPKKFETIDSLLDNKGIKFVKPVMNLADIKKSLQGKKSISFDDIAYIYPRTNKSTFEEFLNSDIFKVKQTELLVRAREIPTFVDSYESAFKDFEEQGNNIKNHFFNDSKVN